MSEKSEIDVPSLPFKKPVELEKLERMGFDQREAMDFVEMKQRIHGIAHNLAEAYKKNKGKSPESCLAITQSALSELGSSLGGKFGTKMVAMSEDAALKACEEVFEED